jgi:hypothetical protein
LNGAAARELADDMRAIIFVTLALICLALRRVLDAFPQFVENSQRGAVIVLLPRSV